MASPIGMSARFRPLVSDPQSPSYGRDQATQGVEADGLRPTICLDSNESMPALRQREDTLVPACIRIKDAESA